MCSNIGNSAPWHRLEDIGKRGDIKERGIISDFKKKGEKPRKLAYERKKPKGMVVGLSSGEFSMSLLLKNFFYSWHVQWPDRYH